MEIGCSKIKRLFLCQKRSQSRERDHKVRNYNTKSVAEGGLLELKQLNGIEMMGLDCGDLSGQEEELDFYTYGRHFVNTFLNE